MSVRTPVLDPARAAKPAGGASAGETGAPERRHSRFWDAYAAAYDALPRHFRPYLLQLERVTEIVQTHYPARGARILDAGCGTGNYALRLSGCGHSVVGFDSAPWMLARARAKAEALAAKAVFEEGLLTERLPYADGSFDCVLSINALYMLERPQTVLSEFRRVLKPGGLLAISHPQRMPALTEILRDHGRRYGLGSVVRAVYAFATLGAFNWVISRNFAKGRYFVWSSEVLEHHLAAAGFRLESLERAYTCDSNLLAHAHAQPA